MAINNDDEEMTFLLATELIPATEQEASEFFKYVFEKNPRLYLEEAVRSNAISRVQAKQIFSKILPNEDNPYEETD